MQQEETSWFKGTILEGRYVAQGDFRDTNGPEEMRTLRTPPSFDVLTTEEWNALEGGSETPKLKYDTRPPGHTVVQVFHNNFMPKWEGEMKLNAIAAKRGVKLFGPVYRDARAFYSEAAP